MKGNHPPECAGMMLASGLLLHQTKFLAGALNERERRIRRQGFRQDHRARSRASTAMGRRESFVEIDVHRVDPEVARADLANDCVEVGSVAIDERAGRM